MESLRVWVCVKPVPDGDTAATPGLRTGGPDRTGRLVLDDPDAVAVEWALRLVEAIGAGEVTVISVAPRTGHGAVRSALAMGAHRAVVVTDDALIGSDALVTAKVLAAAMCLDPDETTAHLVIAGTESTDAATGVVPAQLAELLGRPMVTFARRVEIDADATELRAERVTSRGWDEVACPLPCLVTVATSGVSPRYPSMSGIMGARTKPFEVHGIAALGLSADDVGWVGSRQDVTSVESLADREPATMVDDEAESAHELIIAVLEQAGLI